MLGRFLSFAGIGRASGMADSTCTATCERAHERLTKTSEDWQRELSPEQFRVMRQRGTEKAWESPLYRNFAPGTYHCAACDQPLFSSDTKYHSGSGWPSFYDALPNAVGTSTDRKLVVARTEVHCSRCGGHLGHVFNDGPQPTGKRYCMNGVAMRFEAEVTSLA